MANNYTKSSSLLGLPAELRNTIYRLVLSAETESLKLLPSSSRTALLRTCKQTRHEAAGIYFSENTFHVTLSLKTVDHLARLSSLDRQHAKLVRSAAINIKSTAMMQDDEFNLYIYRSRLGTLRIRNKEGVAEYARLERTTKGIHDKNTKLGREAVEHLVAAGIKPDCVIVGGGYAEARQMRRYVPKMVTLIETGALREATEEGL